jgi:hypothetical protein
MLTNQLILKVVKSELNHAQKLFAQNPNSKNWSRTTQAMLVFQQLQHLIIKSKYDSGIKDQLAHLYLYDGGDWGERIVNMATSKTIAEVLA